MGNEQTPQCSACDINERIDRGYIAGVKQMPAHTCRKYGNVPDFASVKSQYTSNEQTPLTAEEFRYAAMCADVPNKAVDLLSIYEGNNYEQAYEGLKLGIHWERMQTAQLQQDMEISRKETANSNRNLLLSAGTASNLRTELEQAKRDITDYLSTASEYSALIVELKTELEQMKAQRDKGAELLRLLQMDGGMSDDLEDTINTFLSSLEK